MPTSSSDPSHADNAAADHADADSVMATIRAQQARGRGARRVLAVVLVLLAAALVAWMVWPESAPTRWRTETVGRGDMQLTATATGSLEPKSEVSVGAEISGLVEQVLVDENDPVSVGQVLARFDTDELQVALEQAEAQLAVAEASVDEAAATVDEATADERRQTLLRQRGTAAQANLDAAVAARKRAQAQLALARASVRQARATVSQARTRLEKAVITSPINGVVLKRTIEPGSTVAASFQTPELFLLAEDLSAMELHVSMDEADVGLVHPDQNASFTVDAWPGRAFPARVLKVHLYPTVENNVVTYNTVLSVDNTEGLLKPGMTATATIETGRRENVLRVPNVAFRFTPPEAGGGGGLFRRPSGAGERTGPSNTVWRLIGGKPERTVVTTGATDGEHTEVTGGSLKEGEAVITGVLGPAAK